ncbi:CHC2 zinc finger domain-containing protein [Sphingomonas sp. PAMC 26617]|uniref:CHC2 zinc finger domain-containing protein n=1 Tax=Sphingomonas sp. PAMC 26617 TaxID=1112216 RepID=UPI000289352F|nr:CHC2 zinc finger domain-containing protein [Sphingomonas sp. PAMC 26617]
MTQATRKSYDRKPSDPHAFRRLVDEVKANHNISDVVGLYTKLHRRGKLEMVGLCPLHDERSPSFEVNNDKGTWHCWGGCGGGDMFAFLIKREGMTFGEAYRAIAGSTLPLVTEEDRAKRKAESDAILAARVQLAREIWDQAKGAEGTPAQVYALSRGITEPLPNTVRFATIPRWRDPETGEVGRSYPAMVCALQDVAGDLVGVQCVFLADGGKRKYARVNSDGTKAKAKLSYGSIMGSAFRASGSDRTAPPPTHLTLCEGPEDGLTLAQALPGSAVYVACGTALMPRLCLPETVKRITLACDNNPAGREAVGKCVVEFELRGLEVLQMFPVEWAKDWNDELRGIRS